jgi:hypothetical protein
MIQNIIKSIEECRTERPVSNEIHKDYELKARNEFLFFIKPEITLNDDQIEIQAILDMILSKIDSFNLKIKNIRIINAAYLERNNIIAQHYGVINKLSNNVKLSISEEAKLSFEKIYGEPFEAAEIYGSLEFMEQYPYFTPKGISFLWQNNANEKLSGGTYIQKLSLDGQVVYIVNGFHPRQLEHFTMKDRSIVTMTLVSDLTWKEARNDFIGKTNPEEAKPGSIRNILLVNKGKFGLQNISSSWNGVHLSAGPIEGLVELMRYNSNFEHGEIQSATDYNFGKLIASKLPESKAESLLTNPVVEYNGKKISVFDLTEEVDSDNCLKVLEKLTL